MGSAGAKVKIKGFGIGGSGGKGEVNATIYIVDMAGFPTLNALYGEALGDHRPARSTVQVAALPMGALVEIDLVARIPS